MASSLMRTTLTFLRRQPIGKTNMTDIELENKSNPSDIESVIDSVSFLSRLPLHKITAVRTPDFKQISHCFSLAGLIIALPSVAILLLGLALSLPAFVIAILILITQALTTGGLHEDGLADTFDGFGGGASVERKLEIMRDSTIGTYGVLALILSIAMKITVLSSLIDILPALDMVFILLAVAGLSRLAMLWPWTSLPSARQTTEQATNEKDASSLASRHGAPEKGDYLKTMLFALPALLLLLFGALILPGVVALGLAALTTFVMAKYAKKHIGGYTGDVLGATQQVVEIAFYLGLLAVI